MVVVGTAEHGRERRRHLTAGDGFEYFKGEWLETDQAPQRSPTAFLIEQPANAVLKTHFHVQNEFQVVVDGSGVFGRHPVRAISVHYAGAYTGYGPVVAGPRGLKYFTIRSVYESGAYFVPEAKDRLIRGPKVQRYGVPVDPASAGALRALAEPQRTDLFEPSDGAIARLVRMPPHYTLVPAHEGPSDGQFLMVVSGSVESAGARLGPWEMVFVSPDEPDARVCAGADGAEILVMQVPPRAAEYR